MGLNVSTSMGFENKDLLRSAAKNILQNSGASQETASKIIDSSLFDATKFASDTQLSIIKASTQISINKTLSETLKYLRVHANKNSKKTYKFGDLWNIVSANNNSSEENPYKGELYDFEIDKSKRNIFAA